MKEPAFGLRFHRIAIILAMAAANLAWASGLQDDGLAVGHFYLTFLEVIVLLAASALGRVSTPIVGVAALLVTFAHWFVPAGEVLAATVGLLLVAAVGHSLIEALRQTSGELPWGLAIPAALGFGALFRSDLLLEPSLDLPTIVILLVLPVNL